MSTVTLQPHTTTPVALKKRIGTTAFAFRGYAQTNLGKTPEMLAHPKYGPIYERFIREANELCEDSTRRKCDIMKRVHERLPSTIEDYAQDVALVVATALAQVNILEEIFDISITEAQMSLGYSLGEVAAVIAGGVFDMAAAIGPGLVLSRDAVALAYDVKMGILFSRGPALEFDVVRKLCAQITSEGYGVIAVSSYLAPNTALLLGQGGTLDRFKSAMGDVLPSTANLRKNDHIWPPLHTPIVRQANIPNRAAVIMDTAPGGFTSPKPRILSCVTGDFSYNDFNSRELLIQWIDQPQLVWNVVDRTLASGVETILHLGPEPNILPATFNRITNNVTTQLNGKSLSSLGLRAMSQIVKRRRWLTRLLSSDATLLRAPFVEHIVLEDWLLAQEV